MFGIDEVKMAGKHCNICPLGCGADRAEKRGSCGVGGTDGIGGRNPYETAFIARAARHYFEEPSRIGNARQRSHLLFGLQYVLYLLPEYRYFFEYQGASR